MDENINNIGDLARFAMEKGGVEPTSSESVESVLKTSELLGHIQQKVEHAKHHRTPMEQQWYKNTQAFKGIDTSSFRASEESKVYLRTTAVKTRAAYAQIIESLFSDGRFPIEVTATEVPIGVSEFAYLGQEYGQSDEEFPDIVTEARDNDDKEVPNRPVGGVGFSGDGFELESGATIDSLMEGRGFLGGMEHVYPELEGEQTLQPGPSKTGEPQFSPAKESARRLDKLMQDQLTGAKARDSVRKSVFESCLIGTGAIKGPFNVKKRIHNWVNNEETGEREYKPLEIVVPMLSHASLWNLYIDPNANCQEDIEWLAEKHRFNASQLLNLKNRPLFDEEAIDELYSFGGNYVEDNYESQIRGNQYGEDLQELFEVYEFWGYVPVDMLEEFDLDIPEESRDVVQVNMWYSGNKVLRLTINPFLPQRLPYFIFPYEDRPYELYGIGVPEMMEDAQKMMNGFSRLAVDNLALAGNVMLAVDDSALIHGQTDEVYPGKIWRIISGTPAHQAIQSIQFPNTAPENLQMMREFRQQADEATGIPSIAHGQTGVSGFGRTSSGMSMLLQNASLNIKTVIRNFDDYLFKPLGLSLFQWNMQFSTEKFPEIKGDLEIQAKGSQSLQQKEVRAQRLQTFLQISGNPAIAPLIKLPTIIKELAVAMEMNPDEILNSPEEAAIYAQLMGAQGGPGGPGGQQGPQQPQDSPDAPLPNEPGFTGNNAGVGNPEGANGQPASPPQGI